MSDRFLIRDDGVVYIWTPQKAVKPNFKEFIPEERREAEVVTTINSPGYQLAQRNVDAWMRRMDKPTTKKIGRPRKEA